jgi:cytochrome c peroxidase
MKIRITLAALAAAALLNLSSAPPARADGDKLENLKVLDAKLGKKVGKGMKALTKGLGVKCTACHVKGDMDSDKIPTKDATREFLKATLATKDAAAREAALKTLLGQLKLDAAKKPAAVWEAVDMWAPGK